MTLYRLWAFRKSFERSSKNDDSTPTSELRDAVVGTVLPCKINEQHIPKKSIMWKKYKKETMAYIRDTSKNDVEQIKEQLQT